MIITGKTPLLLVISAPSGCGKTTLCNMLLNEFTQMAYSVSCTTRQPRQHETSGKSYHFLNDAEFAALVGKGAFLEHAEVHGFRYGTLKSEVEESLRMGHDIIMDIDVQGAAQIRANTHRIFEKEPIPWRFVDIFIAPPTPAALRERLTQRGQDNPATIELRLAGAEAEMSHWSEYQYLVINNHLQSAFDTLRAIVIAEHHRIR